MNKEKVGKKLLDELLESGLMLFCIAIGYIGMSATKSLLISIIALFFFVGGFWRFWVKREHVKAAYIEWYAVGGHPWRSGTVLLLLGAILILAATGLENNKDAGLTLFSVLTGIMGGGLVFLGATIIGPPRQHDIL